MQDPDILIQHPLQWPEVQAQLIRAQAKQGPGRGETHAVVVIGQQRAEQQAALWPGHQADHAVDGCLAHQGRRVVQVFTGQLEGQRAWVIGQFGVQAGAANVRQVVACQLLVKHTRRAGQTIVCTLQGLAVALGDSLGWSGCIALDQQPAGAQHGEQAKANDRETGCLGHAWIQNS
ncbi:hypothetical protein D3C85_1178400 [compost metagenome]